MTVASQMPTRPGTRPSSAVLRPEPAPAPAPAPPPRRRGPGRVVRTIIGLGLLALPLWLLSPSLWSVASTQAAVNARLVTLRAPIEGRRWVDRSAEADRNEARPRALPTGRLPSVDVFLPTYNEGPEVLGRSILAALAIDHPNFLPSLGPRRRRARRAGAVLPQGRGGLHPEEGPDPCPRRLILGARGTSARVGVVVVPQDGARGGGRATKPTQWEPGRGGSRHAADRR